MSALARRSARLAVVCWLASTWFASALVSQRPAAAFRGGALSAPRGRHSPDAALLRRSATFDAYDVDVVDDDLDNEDYGAASSGGSSPYAGAGPIEKTPLLREHAGLPVIVVIGRPNVGKVGDERWRVASIRRLSLPSVSISLHQPTTILSFCYYIRIILARTCRRVGALEPHRGLEHGRHDRARRAGRDARPHLPARLVVRRRLLCRRHRCVVSFDVVDAGESSRNGGGDGRDEIATRRRGSDEHAVAAPTRVRRRRSDA